MTESLTVGSTVAGYRLEALIGRGGMAVLYRAQDLRLDRKVALKLLAPDLSQHDQFRQRFVRESRMAASLDHPNIVPIFEAGEANGVLYIVMRYVVGSDLKVILERDRPLEAARTLRLVAQVADALDAAHVLGLVHRDVKPGNILITPTADRGEHVYLTDFGLTKRTSSLSGLTGTGHFLGTIDYVAPEQISGKAVEPRTDIYALGCMLYECLTGELPFHREDDAAMLWAHLVESAPPVTALRPDLPPQVDAVVAGAMAKLPEDRYDTCRDLVLDLEDALGITLSRPMPRQRSGFDTPAVAPGQPTQDSDVSPAADTGPRGPHPSFPPGEDTVREPAYSSYDDERASLAQEVTEPPAQQEPTTAPLARQRWRIPLAVGLAMVIATAVAIVLVTGRGTKLDTHYTKSTIVPFSFDRPSSWAEHDAGVDVVFSPSAAQVGPLFTAKGAGGTWTAAQSQVQQDESKVVGLYTVFTTTTEIDNSTPGALEAALRPLLPADVTFDQGDKKVLVGGFAADSIGGVVSDPASGTALRFVTYVVQLRQQQAASVQLTFFAAADKFNHNRPLFDRILRTVSFLG